MNNNICLPKASVPEHTENGYKYIQELNYFNAIARHIHTCGCHRYIRSYCRIVAGKHPLPALATCSLRRTRLSFQRCRKNGSADKIRKRQRFFLFSIYGGTLQNDIAPIHSILLYILFHSRYDGVYSIRF